MSHFVSTHPTALRLSLRRFMGAVAVLALLLAILIPTARTRIDWARPRVNDIAVTVALMVLETIILFYAILAISLAGGLFQPPEKNRRLKAILIYGPALLFVALLLLFEVLDAFLGPH